MMWEVLPDLIPDFDAVADPVRSAAAIRLNRRFVKTLNQLNDLRDDCEAAGLQDSARDITRAILVARGFYITEEEEGN